jgi:signal transduction histidine kinase
MEDRAPVVHGKIEHYTEIIKQIVDNAIKFSPVNSDVNIILKSSGEESRFICRDTGKGIPAHSLDRVFESFYQVEEYDTRTTEGLGLGLTISKKLVELYNGRISIESKEGAGTEVTVVIPVIT